VGLRSSGIPGRSRQLRHAEPTRASSLLVSVLAHGCDPAARPRRSEIARCDQVGLSALSICTLAASLAARCRRGDASAVTAEYAGHHPTLSSAGRRGNEPLYAAPDPARCARARSDGREHHLGRLANLASATQRRHTPGTRDSRRRRRTATSIRSGTTRRSSPSPTVNYVCGHRRGLKSSLGAATTRFAQCLFWRLFLAEAA
jgi:hypothetical protein